MTTSLTSELQITDARLRPIADKVLAGERLTAADGILLYRSPDLLAVGWLANHIREKRHGDICYFNVNRHINPTNICVAHCKLCAFGRDPTRPALTILRWMKFINAPRKAFAPEPRNFTWLADCIPICRLNIFWI